ncbi:MAG: maleylacetoacetate isomerase [Rhodobacteraceae bacterium]|nr:maleylacetoacetate isomerase [Paracoccaceae bacterium]
MSIVLYDYWRSSACYRVRIALNLCGLAFETKSIDLTKGEQFERPYLEINPQGLVPSLRIGEVVLTQSLAIIEHLDALQHYPFLPGSSLDRSRQRALAYAVAMEIHPICNLSVATFVEEASGGNITMASWAQRFISSGLGAIEESLSRTGAHKYCLGDEPAMADVCLVPQVYNARRWNVQLGDCPRIGKIVEELEKLEAFSRAHPDNYKQEN